MGAETAVAEMGRYPDDNPFAIDTMSGLMP
jgi:hypothetical protein